MTATTFLDGRVTLHGGDCLDILKTLPDASIDSVVTDPPYHLTSIVKRFGGANAAPAKTKQTGAFARSSKGFMGQIWDGGDIAFRQELWAEALRVLKPGGHLAAFSGTRTYHRMAVAIEDAGFEIRDQLAWTYGSGFPKSHDVSKAIDARAKLGSARTTDIRRLSMGEAYEPSGRGRVDYDNGGGSQMNGAGGAREPETDAAREWQGWGTALKPAWEPICLARKPLDGTVAANVLAHGVGALNIDGCRVVADLQEMHGRSGTAAIGNVILGAGIRNPDGGVWKPNGQGRFPANLIHDGSPEVLSAFPDTAPSRIGKPRGAAAGDGWGMTMTGAEYSDEGSAARFFYTAKADADDRIGSKHPTVKPVDLMQWLVRLVTPKGGVVLDLFAGTGTTGEAAWREGCRAVLIEREPVYREDIARRMALAAAGPQTRRAAIAAVKAADDHGPLFDMPEAAE